jgi:hypothetical protein
MTSLFRAKIIPLMLAAPRRLNIRGWSITTTFAVTVRSQTIPGASASASLAGDPPKRADTANPATHNALMFFRRIISALLPCLSGSGKSLLIR